MVQSYKMFNSNLNNKNVVITGAAGTLGNNFSNILLENNANIALVDVNQKKLKKLYNDLKIKKNNSKINYYCCDVSDEKKVNNVISKILKDFKTINVLINNAATKTNNPKSFFDNIENYKYKTWNEVMSVNLGGMFLFAQKIGKSMIKNKVNGSIIQISSLYGLVAPDYKIYKGIKDKSVSHSPISYMVSKSALEGLTKYLSAHWGKYNIRVNSVCPGGIDIGLDTTFKKNYINKVPLNRMATPKDLDGIILYLSSDSSSYVTGQNFVVDGGYTVI